MLSIQEWSFPKADLYHFVGFLNRLDSLLESTLLQENPDYLIGHPSASLDNAAGGKSAATAAAGAAEKKPSSPVQPLRFSPAAKRLILSILHFSRLLQENSTNRNVYNSYEVRSRVFKVCVCVRDPPIASQCLTLRLGFGHCRSDPTLNLETCATSQLPAITSKCFQH